MKLTKFQHASFVVEKDGQALVVDPGAFAHDFVMPKNVVAIVVTHEHADHLDPQKIEAIHAAYPNAQLIAHESITAKFPLVSSQAVVAGDAKQVGAFHVSFHGGEHASIDATIPVPPNLGVFIDETIYYPGDSFVSPGAPVKILALPVSAPWLKISEVLSFVDDVKASFVFPTHDEILSEDGQALVDRLSSARVTSYGGDYRRLNGASIEL